jgi:hypothetical protein
MPRTIRGDSSIALYSPLSFLYAFINFLYCFFEFWDRFGRRPAESGKLLRLFVRFWGALGDLVAMLGGSWRHFGGSWSDLGLSLGRLGVSLGRLVAIFGESWCILGRPCDVLPGGVVKKTGWTLKF